MARRARKVVAAVALATAATIAPMSAAFAANKLV